MFTQITLGNILSDPILYLQILFLILDYRRKYSDSAHYIQTSPRFHEGIFCLTPYYSCKYFSLAQFIPSNILPQPRLSTEIFCLSSVYSMFTQITLGNILSYPILYLQIVFLIPDYRRNYSDSALYIQTSPKLH